ncbi:LuxR C-terminal-related transcriptional regulator [Saccharopolyspora spinosa]|uniref:LuxR C-terminal-related transcriptional regulator n=1 Tax=Saccharopolyspora spinosa TaxID=60894 RepID=UPI000237885C
MRIRAEFPACAVAGRNDRAHKLDFRRTTTGVLPGIDRVFGALCDGIAQREREVLALITCGMSNTEIEQRLRVSRSTVKSHTGRLMTKLDARDRGSW